MRNELMSEYKEDLLRRETEEKLQKIGLAKQGLRKDQRRLLPILASLKSKLPDLLARHLLGEADRSQADKVKAAIKRCEDWLEEISILAEPLERMENKASSQIRECDHLKKTRQRYEGLKAEMRESSADLNNLDLLKTIQVFPRELNDPDDYNNFISEMKKRKMGLRPPLRIKICQPCKPRSK